MKPNRTAWNDFPDVTIHAPESTVKHHPLYRAAKTGDAEAAQQLARELVSRDQIENSYAMSLGMPSQYS